MKRWTLLGIALLSPCAIAVEILQWQRIPLPVQLAVEQERIVFVDRTLRVGMPPDLHGKLRVQSIAGAIYLKASAAIESARIQLQDVHNGEILLLDIAATTRGDALEPLRIISTVQRGEPRTPAENAPTPTAGTPVPVLLTRHAAQMLYAPLRAIEPLPGVRPVPLRAEGELTSLLPDLEVKAHAVAAWALADWTVTAVRLSNPGPQRIMLDPRRLQGDFHGATFQHDYLGAAGSPEDTTIVYLVTQGRSLEAALWPAPPDSAHDQ